MDVSTRLARRPISTGQTCQERREEQDWHVVKAIAQRMLGARDLDADPELRAALLAAYRVGKVSGLKQPGPN